MDGLVRNCNSKMSTSSVGAVLRDTTTEQLPSAFNEVKATGNRQLSEDEIDAVLDKHIDLVSEEFRGWHRRQILRLGVDRYIGLASDARREGRNKPKFFSFLLRKTV